MKIFDFTKWEVLEIYYFDGHAYCIQVRMNKRTGLKKFRVNRITKAFTSCHNLIKEDKINELTKS